MKQPDIHAICPGIEAVPNEPLVFEVQSDSDPDVKYRVDKGAWWGFGHCSCEYFAMKCNPELKRGALPSARLECKHQKRLNRFIAIWLAREMIKQQQEAANKNRMQNGHAPAKYNPEAPVT